MRIISATGIIALLLVSLNCTGARGHMKFTDLKYPTSLSGALYGRNNTVLLKDRQLKTVEKFHYAKRFWGMTYSWIRLSGSSDVDAAINKAVEKAKGQGVINLKITETECNFNYYIGIPFGILPITPGCVNAEIEGDIVRVM